MVSWIAGSSETASASRDRLTGTRSWTSFRSSLASVVMIVHVRIASRSGESIGRTGQKSYSSMEIARGCCSIIIRDFPHVAVLAPETGPHAKRIGVRSQGVSTRIG